MLYKFQVVMNGLCKIHRWRIIRWNYLDVRFSVSHGLHDVLLELQGSAMAFINIVLGGSTTQDKQEGTEQQWAGASNPNYQMEQPRDR